MPTEIQDTDVIVFGILFLVACVLTMIGFFIGASIRRKSVAISPYTGFPLRRGDELPYESARKILQFIYDLQDYDNRLFDIKKAAICRETGRVFPKSISWLDVMSVDWNFLQKKYPGHYVSWGSLSPEQQSAIRRAHGTLEGFQTEISSKDPAPSAVTAEFAYAKPGPLYVDLQTKVVLGWKRIPSSDFEVLIVQKPKRRY